MQALAAAWGEELELHLVGHSAGSIILGSMLGSAAARPELKSALKSVHLYAPACTVAFACKHYASDENVMKRLHIDVLSDKDERDDNVARSTASRCCISSPMRSRPTCARRSSASTGSTTPAYAGWDGSSDTGEALATWRAAAKSARLSDRTSVVSTDRVRIAVDSSGKDVTQRPAHGSFDNDLDVVARTLTRITGAQPTVAVDDLRGY